MDHAGELNAEGAGSLNPSGLVTGFYQTNSLGRYSAQNLSEGSTPSVLPNLIASPDRLPDLTQSNLANRAEIERDNAKGISYFKFRTEAGSYYEAAAAFNFPPELTILALVRIQVDREGPNLPAIKRVGTFLNLGNRDLQFFYDLGEVQTDLQTRLPGGSARFSVSEPDPSSWRVYVVGFGDPYNEAVFDRTIVTADPYQEPESDASGSFSFSVGLDDSGRGYLDADIAEIEIFEGRASRFEALQLAGAMLERTLETGFAVEGVGTLGLPEPTVDRIGEASLEGVGQFSATGAVDPSDFGALAWYSALNPEYAGAEDCKTFPTWFDSSGGGLNMSFSYDEPCRPSLCELYRDQPAFKFNSGGSGIVCAPTGLDDGPYTIFVLGRAPKGAGFRCYFQVIKAIGVGLKQNADDPNFDDLIITTNPGTAYRRRVVYYAAVERYEFFELLIEGEPGVPDFELTVSVNRVELVPDEIDPVSEPDPIVISDPCDPSVEYTPEDPYAVPYTRTFQFLKTGDVRIGLGDCGAYSEILWWDKILTPGELAQLYAWLDARYIP